MAMIFQWRPKSINLKSLARQNMVCWPGVGKNAHGILRREHESTHVEMVQEVCVQKSGHSASIFHGV